MISIGKLAQNPRTQHYYYNEHFYYNATLRDRETRPYDNTTTQR